MEMTEGLKATEAECAAGRTAPRVSLDDIKANIALETYFRALDAIHAEGCSANGKGTYGQEIGKSAQSLKHLTICILVLQNGFAVIGKSAPASPENYSAELGQKLAYEDAVRQIWPLMGYALREKLASMPSAVIPPAPDMRQYTGTKAINAKPMTRLDYNTLRGWELPADEDGSDAGYLVEYADGNRPNVDGFDGYVSWSPADVFETSYQLRHPG